MALDNDQKMKVLQLSMWWQIEQANTAGSLKKILKNLLTLLASTDVSAHPRKVEICLQQQSPKGAWCNQNSAITTFRMGRYQGINLVVFGLVNNATPIPLAI